MPSHCHHLQQSISLISIHQWLTIRIAWFWGEGGNFFLLDSLQRRRRRWTKPGVGAWLVGVGAGCTWCHRIGTSVALGPPHLLLFCHQGRGLKTGSCQLCIFRWKREFSWEKTMVCNYGLSHWRPSCPPGPGSAGLMGDVVLPRCQSLPQGLTHFTPAIWGHLGCPKHSRGPKPTSTGSAKCHGAVGRTVSPMVQGLPCLEEDQGDGACRGTQLLPHLCFTFGVLHTALG